MDKSDMILHNEGAQLAASSLVTIKIMDPTPWNLVKRKATARQNDRRKLGRTVRFDDTTTFVYLDTTFKQVKVTFTERTHLFSKRPTAHVPCMTAE